ncbi:MAG: tetratricopeptide repeat protein [Chloroflexi bacterium]|nr:tetratricopeptide repeat protein [Chloroflexota bacterium]
MKSNTNNTNQQDVIDELRANLDSVRENNDTKEMLPGLSKLGLAYLESGDAPKALTQFDEGLKIALEQENNEAEAQFLGLTGLAIKHIGNYSLALQKFRKSNRIARKIDHHILICDSYIQIALLLSENEEHTKAISQLGHAMKIASDNSDQARRMRIASLMADNFHILSAFDKAVEYYVLAYEISQEIGNHLASSTFLTKVGNIFLIEKEYESAVGQYERALGIAEKIEDTQAAINILGGLFRAHAQQGNSRLAKIYAEQVINLAGSIEHHEAELANIHAYSSFLIDQGQLDDCIPYLEQGLETAQSQDNESWKIAISSDLGFVFYNLDQLDQALANYHNSLDFAVQYQNQAAEAKILGRIGAILADQGEIKTGLEKVHRGLELAHQIEDHALVAEHQTMLAFLYQDQDNAKQAIIYCKNALATYQTLGDSEKYAMVEALLSELQDI